MNRSVMVAAPSMCFCGTIARPKPRADWATNDSAITEARARSSRTCSVVDVEQLLQAPERGEHGEGALHIDADVAGMHRDGERLGGRQARVERPIDEQAPHVAVVVRTDEVFDVDTAVAQRAAFSIGLGDLRSRRR